MDDVRKATERLRAWDEASSTQAYFHALHEAHRQDMETLARAWLAEHPADDGEAVTPEWLASLAGRVVDPTDYSATLIQFDGRGCVVIEEDLSVAIQQGMYNDTDGQYISTPVQAKTRGDVRRLLAVFGITAMVQ